MIQAMLIKLKKWIDFTIRIHIPIMVLLAVFFVVEYGFSLDVDTRVRVILGVLMAIGLYTLSIAIQLRKFPVFIYSRLELAIHCICYLFFQVWFVVLLIGLILLGGLHECLRIPNVVLCLIAVPGLYFFGRNAGKQIAS